MPYYLSTALVSWRGRGTLPYGVDPDAGCNWILYDNTQSILWSPVAITGDARLILLEDEAEERATVSTRNTWATRILGDGRNMPLASTLRELIVDALRVPPVDARQVRELKPGRSGSNPGYKIWLGPGVVTGIPLFYERTTPQRSSKTFVDTFNRADGNLGGSTSSDGLFSWLEVDGTGLLVVSNAVSNNNLSGFLTVRADADLDTDDHYSQVVLASISTPAGIALAEVLVRYASGPLVGYGYEVGDSASWQRMYRCDTDGTLASGSGTAGAGDTCYLEIDGSSLTAKVNGATRLGPTTNTQFSGQLRCGTGCYVSQANDDITLDNFQCGDLSVTPSTRIKDMIGFDIMPKKR